MQLGTFESYLECNLKHKFIHWPPSINTWHLSFTRLYRYIAMEVERVTRIKSKYLNDSVILYHCRNNPGYVYKFSCRKANEYRCCRCRELGKQRSITVIDDVVVRRTNPEDDHHPECVPIREEVATAVGIDREMRNEVGFLLGMFLQLKYNLY